MKNEKHGETLPDDSTPQEKRQEDYKFNYHSAKLTFGLVLLEFNDAIKEGDGARLFELYKLALQDLWSLQVCVCSPFVFGQVHCNPSTISGIKVEVEQVF